MPARRSTVEESETRTALLDAAQAIMLEEGYAAVTTRRIASRAGVNSALVYYYFGTMDDLFVALFRRGAEQNLARQAAALASPQPLWGLWDTAFDRSSAALTMEFVALANHRKAIRVELAAYIKRFRRLQLDALAGTFEGYGVDTDEWPEASLVLLLDGVSLLLRMEDTFGVDLGHADTVALIERSIRALEGRRRPRPRRAASSSTD